MISCVTVILPFEPLLNQKGGGGLLNPLILKLWITIYDKEVEIIIKLHKEFVFCASLFFSNNKDTLRPMRWSVL